MPLIRLGLQIPSFTYPGVPDAELFERIAAIATTAESSGFDSVFVMDHLNQIGSIGPRHEPMLESYTLLSGIAARTKDVNLGALVTGVTYRNPAFLAKVATTLDIVSSGRAILGLGAAWNEDEHRGFGYRFPPASERLGRLEEALQICRAMFREDAPTFEGRHYRIHEVLNFPRPVRAGGPPILVGGMGERKTLRLVARYADACNIFGDPATARHKLDVLAGHCDELGRDPDEITKSRLGTLVLGESDEAAARKVDRLVETTNWSEQLLREWALVGGPERVTEEVHAFLDAGLDGLIFNLPGAEDLETVSMAGEVLSKAVAG
jgi:F420-dependent oxidoreductase-like protein